MRRLLLAALLLFPLTAEATSPAKARRSMKVFISALEHARADDPAGAYALVSKALRIDPENVDAHYFRALLLLEGSKAADSMLASEMQRAARMDLTAVLQLDPEGDSGKKALELLDAMRGADLFPLPDAECSEEARAAISEAEGHFSSGDVVKAEAAYARATASCPQNALWWTWYGDVYFQQDEYARAIQMYQKALAIEPCFWTAHRFLADAQRHGGDDGAAYGSLLRAVSCNPQYEDGWADLVAFSAGHGVTLERPYLPIPGPEEAAQPSTATATEQRIEEDAGRLYVRTLTTSTAPDALGKRREAVTATLGWLADGRLGTDPQRQGLRTWGLLARARNDGYLDEAILLFLLDAELLPELKARQASQLDRFTGFMRTQVAPVQGL